MYPLLEIFEKVKVILLQIILYTLRATFPSLRFYNDKSSYKKMINHEFIHLTCVSILSLYLKKDAKKKIKKDASESRK